MLVKRRCSDIKPDKVVGFRNLSEPWTWIENREQFQHCGPVVPFWGQRICNVLAVSKNSSLFSCGTYVSTRCFCSWSSCLGPRWWSGRRSCWIHTYHVKGLGFNSIWLGYADTHMYCITQNLDVCSRFFCKILFWFGLVDVQLDTVVVKPLPSHVHIWLFCFKIKMNLLHLH